MSDDVKAAREFQAIIAAPAVFVHPKEPEFSTNANINLNRQSKTPKRVDRGQHVTSSEKST